MSLPPLKLSAIKRAATEKSFARGEDYFQAEAVVNATLRQQTLYAEVEGNEVEPYRVTVEFDEGGVTKARCSCPYSFEGWCKHIVATLLVCIHQPETVKQRPSLGQLLEKLSPAQAKEMIQSLVTEDPLLLESIDFYISSLAPAEVASTTESSSKRRSSVDPAPYKRHVKEILRDAVRGWEYGDDNDSISGDLEILMLDAIAFSEKGDSGNAIAVLQAITEASAQYWYIVDDFIGMGPEEFGIDFDSAWTEVLLGTDLSTGEVTSWKEELEVWQDSLGSFEMALEALRQGWDYSPLQRVFAGEITEQGAWEGEAPYYADDFSQIRLKILERDERYEDYLLLAEAEGRTKEYLTMLGQLGRTDEAMDVAKEQMTTLSEAMSLANMLRDQDHSSQALDIAMQGLQLDYENSHRTFEFASWTYDLAEELEEQAVALEALVFAFKAKPSLKGYQTIQSLSGEEWPEMKEQLLQQIRQMSFWQESDAQIDILLHENLADDAIEKVSELSGFKDALTLRVMDEVIGSRSQWVVDTAIHKAQQIIEAKKAKYYSTAIDWLTRAKSAYLAIGKEADWQRYRRELADTHGRKRKLMELLAQNRL